MVASNIRVKYKAGAWRKLRQEPDVHADLLRRARAVAEAAGGEDMGYRVTPLYREDPRGATSVMATGMAHAHNRKHTSLLRSLDAGRG